MKTLVVGGTFHNENGISSKIIETMATLLGAKTINGGVVKDLHVACTLVENKNLIIWAPNVSNEEKKVYPKKNKGSVLIVSKRISKYGGRSEIDAVSRIFKFNGNAVITITDKNEKVHNTKPEYVFKLIDALGNVWVDTTKDIKDIVVGIYKLYMWTKESKRESILFSLKLPSFIKLQKLIDINKVVAEKCQKAFGERYFGNLSTRCVSMFPSMRESEYFLFSARNTNKEFLAISDMIFVSKEGNYGGNIKPSVDTPVQLQLYDLFSNINFMIHGHAYIENASYTDEYFPCGDLREVNGIRDLGKKYFKYRDVMTINLKNHGFLIMTKAIEQLEEAVNNSVFKTKGIENVYE